MRRPFQGVCNIIRFNRHFYIAACIIAITVIVVAAYTATVWILPIAALVVVPAIISLTVTWYVYDYSPLYKFEWINSLALQNTCIINANTGFDETTAMLREKFADAEIATLDFYDPARHTEISMKRARSAYPPAPGTINANTQLLPVIDNYADMVLIFLSAHEIRETQERTGFFRELHRILKDNGKIAVTEHLRDLPNFLAYTIGFLHFHTGAAWRKNFKDAGLVITKEIKHTPFITTFILAKNGNTL